MDIVRIQGLQLSSLIGVYEFERHAKQRVTADLEIITDLSKAALSDDVTDTIDYGKVAERLESIAARSEYRLLEALAKEMLDSLMQEFKPQSVTLTLGKPDILPNTQNVSITMTRSQH